jgi:hypothetical protein
MVEFLHYVKNPNSHGLSYDRCLQRSLTFNLLIVSFILLPGIFLALEITSAQTLPDRFVKHYRLDRNPDALLKKILSKDEFLESDRESISEKIRKALLSLSDRFWAWLRSKLNVKIPEYDAENLWTTLGSFALAFVAALAGFAALYVFRHFWQKRFPRVLTEETSAAEYRLTSEESWNTAQELAEAGSYGEALIHLFRYAVLWLDENGKVSLPRMKTNREVLLSLKDPRIAGNLRKMIPIFNKVRYGNYSCNREDYDNFVAMCRVITDGT